MQAGDRGRTGRDGDCGGDEAAHGGRGGNLAIGDAACKQAVVGGEGVAVVVAAMGLHTADAVL